MPTNIQDEKRASSPPTTEQQAYVEFELIRSCSRMKLTPAHEDRIRTLVDQDIDWGRLVGKAFHHKVLPLVYRNLSDTCPNAIPEKVMNNLRGRYKAISLQSVLLSEALLGLLNMFRAHDIPVIPYRGPALAAGAYGDVTYRMFGDIDLLIRRRHLDAAEELMVEEGYTRKSHPDYAREYGKGRVSVELHWTFGERFWGFSLRPDDLFGELKTVELRQSRVRSLSPENALLTLCMHAARDFFRQRAHMSQLCDMAEVIRAHPDLDWHKVLRRADEFGLTRIVRVGLYLADEMLDARLPDDLRDDLRSDRTIAALAFHIRPQIIAGKSYSAGWLETYTTRYHLLTGTANRLRFLLHALRTC